ncbi:diguanylate cyclase (GGDEF) domain-containing protein [Malonomonas rubra DSM 5091]|uniref:diguanylate cyclase n=1 Tax=Malonomonas rubra DSM 5091 TaxID=1122189 RepID=A0A1M6LF30_MALRU|nr:GGDEF domain-containing protein [Malonomonas rubra]SHJ69767.1 diguanylate cyclase (GGDEF) domain-containing protein [Malonomonas rubra DSM 5091]
MNNTDMALKIREMIEEQINLPSPPAVAVQILNAVQKQDTSLHELARIITADPALTGKMLSIANSGFYALPNEVTSIERALSVLGTNLIKNIALSFVIAAELRGDKASSFDFEYFWKRSVTSAVAAELLAKLLNANNEDIFVTGLLHDIGVLVMYLSKGDEYTALLHERKRMVASLTELEKQKFGFDHQQLGFTLVCDWGLPDKIAEPIRYHHLASEAPEQHRQTTQILWFADLLSSIYTESDSGEKVRDLQNKMSETFNLDEDAIRELLDDVATKSIRILKTFEIDPGDLKPYSQMLQEANAELGKLNLSYEQLVMELKDAKEKAESLASELRDANSRLKELVSRDGLTGLYNHRYFQEILDKEMARAQRYQSSLSLIMFDIDFFKDVNDSFGHPAGDLVLMNLARVVEGAVRPSDIVARYGGEEFAVILPETNKAGMRVFSERLRRCVEGVTTLADNQQIQVTISVGGTSIVPEQTNLDKQDLIDAADRALYESKRNGRNRVTIVNATD